MPPMRQDLTDFARRPQLQRRFRAREPINAMPQRYVVTTLENLPPGSARAFTVATRKLAFFNVAGRVYAIDDVCPHDGAPLSEGTLEGATVTCPWHGAEFDVT